MKKLLIISLLSFIFVGSTFAQTFTVSKGKSSSSISKTTTNLTIDGLSFKSYKTKSGTVVVIKKDGGKKYLGKVVGKTNYKGKNFTVFSHSKGRKYRIFYNKSGKLSQKGVSKN